MTTARALSASAVALAIFAFTTPAANAQRPDTRAYHCQAIHASLSQYGSLVMSFSNTQYRRFVGGQGYCGPSQVVEYFYVPALDTPRCQVRICKEKMFTD